MTKQEVKKAENHDLIRETINTYALLMTNYNTNKSIKQLDKHFRDCGEELIKRELLTQEDFDSLNR